MRAADRPGVGSDEGEGDARPGIRRRMHAFLSETDDAGRMVSFGRVAVCAIVGNEDGAHHSSAEIFRALNDVGLTIPAVAATYWVGEAMHTTDYRDLPRTPEATARTTAMVAAHAARLARLLRASA